MKYLEYNINPEKAIIAITKRKSGPIQQRTNMVEGGVEGRELPTDMGFLGPLV